MRARKLTLAAVLALAVLVSGATGAQASIGQLFSFGASTPGGLNGPRGLALDPNTGDVYVNDFLDNRVVKYDPSGNFILTFGWKVNATKVAEGAPEAEQNVCTAASGNTCQAGSAGSGPGQLTHPNGNPAIDPNTGDVYVGSFGIPTVEHRVEKFSSDGAYISQIVGEAGGVPTFRAFSLGTDLEGNLYVVTANNGSEYEHQVLKFDPFGAYTGTEFVDKGGATIFNTVAVDQNGFVYVGLTGAAVLQGAPGRIYADKFNVKGSLVATLELPSGDEQTEQGLAVDLLTGDTFVEVQEGPNRNEILEFDPSGVQLNAFSAPVDQFDALAYDAGAGRLYDLNREAEEVDVFGTFPVPPAQAPSIARESSSGVSTSGVVLSAQINPHLADTTYYFQYGTDPSLAGAATSPASPADIGAGYIPHQVTAALSGLPQSTLYYYRAVVHSTFGGGSGTTVEGPIQTFTTLAPPPGASTGAPSEVAARSVVLNGLVTPGSTGAASDTRYCFEYGEAGAAGYNLGFIPGAPAGDAGQGSAGVPVGVRVGRLEAGMTYRYRLVAVDSIGLGGPSTACGTEGGYETDGAQGTFTTTAPAAPFVETGAATSVTQNAVVLSGLVNPEGFSTGYAFEIGTDTSYGVQIFAQAGSGGEPSAVSTSVGYLQPGTTYHYRLAATNAGGTSYGADRTFTTPTYAGAVLSAPGALPLIASPPFLSPTIKRAGNTVTVKHKKKVGKRKRGKRARRARRSSIRHNHGRGSRR